MEVVQEQLLELQDLDTRIEQLTHQHQNPPEQAELNGVEKALAELNASLSGMEAELKELQQNQKRLEDEIALSKEKLLQDEEKMSSGAIVVPKELEALGHSIQTRKEHQNRLEDEVLEFMEQEEPLAVEVTALAEQTSVVAQNQANLKTHIEKTSATITQELETLGSQRQSLAGNIDVSLMELYEKLRIHCGGVGVARLEGAQCHGCDINMVHPTSEVERLNSLQKDEIAQCEECQRILIAISIEAE